MPQNLKLVPKDQPWESRYVAIYQCSPREQKATEIVVADRAGITKNADLKRVLGVLQQGMISKREYPGAVRPTIRYANFQKAGRGNNAQALLGTLLEATTVATVRRAASDLANRYVRIKNVQKGVLIILLSALDLKATTARNCVFIFKCDFEDISQLSPKQIFRRVENAFEEQAKKGAQYPYFDGRKFDAKTTRVFDALGETQYWLNFLELVLPPTEVAQVQRALIATLSENHPALIEKYGETLRSVGKERPLATDQRLIEAPDLLTPQDVKNVIASLPGDSKVSLSLDRVRVAAPVKEFGRKWMIAAQDGTYFILIKGAQLDVHDNTVTAFDVGELVDLPQAASELGMPVSFRRLKTG